MTASPAIVVQSKEEASDIRCSRFGKPPGTPKTGGELSFAERKAEQGEEGTMVVSAQVPAPVLVDRGNLARHIGRPLPGDAVAARPEGEGNKGHGKKVEGGDLLRKRSTVGFFEEAFGVAGEGSAARERVRGDAIVMAEVKTNVIISDEFTFITELSYHLSTRYQRPVSSIVVTLQHGACMFFAGSFEAAYIMSVSALSSHLLPTTNKRNAALIQKHMEEALGVSPARGLLRFVATNEENMAHNGKTMAGEIEELERSYSRSPTPMMTDEKAETTPKAARMRKKLSVRGLASFRPPSRTGAPDPELTPPASADKTLPTISVTPDLPPVAADATKKARRKKSFVASIFGRSGSRLDYSQGLSTIRGG